MATHYIPNSSGWASQKASGTWISAAGRGHLYLKCERTYNQSTNKSTLDFTVWGYSEYYEGTFDVSGTIKVNGSNLVSFNTLHKLATWQDTTFRQVTQTGGTNHWSVTLDHDSNGTLSVPIVLDLLLTYTAGSSTYAMKWGYSATFTATEPRASSITVASSVYTQDTLTIQATRASSAYYHKVTIKKDSTTLYGPSAAFATSHSLTVPRSWFNSFTTTASLSCTVSVQTYSDSSCSTAVGSPVTKTVTVKADSGMKPVLASGYATAAAYNTGTAAAGITGYVSGISKAEVTLNSSKLTLANNATVGSISVTGGGVTATSSPYRTGVLTGTATITVTVTDSRGLSATQTLTVQTMPYAAPTISSVTVFRCNSGGTEDESGAYYSAKATAGCSSLNNQNSVTLTAACKQGSGSYGSETTLTSGSASILGGTLDPDQTLSVRLTATDALGTATQVYVTLPPRVWAMKFRPNGMGVGFGMAPTEDNVLQLPTGWKIKIGTTVVAHD